MTSCLGALTYQIRVNGEVDRTTSLSDVHLENLESGTFYSIQIYSVGIGNRLSEEGSDVITIQTGNNQSVERKN